MKNVLEVLKREIVLSISLLLAIISSCFVKPSYRYLDYIDFRTLAILFCLMCVVSGWREIGVFDWVARKLLCFVRGSRQLLMFMVFLCFFFSMFITNDVALITFIPFTVIVLRRISENEMERLFIPTVVLQTVAANMGSMLTPIGNPQNLYLYGKSGIALGDFFKIMLPYTVMAFVLLIICCMSIKNVSISSVQDKVSVNGALMNGKRRGLVCYTALFILCFLTVARILPYTFVLIVVVVVIAALNWRIFTKVDYSLLLTFVGLFIFIGNMSNILIFRSFVENILEGYEVFTAVIASQIISNVPAAILLSGFTYDYTALLVGTNLGGLGTLIASMASLISYKYVVAERPDKKGVYLLQFTIVNVIFLIIEFLFYYINFR